ncbi:MAG TPA: hypothetical protein VJM10_08265, partial [Candidatus Methylomirabilis sp.]|nr:hypothetical protein [Candidatus Methylomirabilis sp.]
MTPLTLSLERLVRCDEPGDPLWGDDRAALWSRLPDHDSVAKVTCYSNCWYQRACSLNAYVKDGIVLRAEPTGVYPPPTDPALPDRNPRSCQKGIVYPQRM